MDTEMNTTITRRSKVGFGYNTSASQVWNKSQTQSFLQVDETTRPYHTGTILSVQQAIQNDRTFQGLRSGTYYTSAWFVKINGQWRRIKDTNENTFELFALTSETDPNERTFLGRRYWKNEITVEVE